MPADHRARTDQSESDVRCEWGAAGLQSIGPDAVAVIVDVLSFTTCVSIGCAAGATVYPSRWTDSRAEEFAASQGATVAARRGADDGFSLSPASLVKIPRGARLVLPSPNGSALACLAQERGLAAAAGCLRNAAAVARWADAQGRPVALVPAGERWEDGSVRFAVEDLLGAGAIISLLRGDLSPEAEAAVAAFLAARGDLEGALRRSSSGRELIGRGFEQDVVLASAVNADRVTPVLTGLAFVAAGAGE
ncbi:MAG TPA: 2-phosphosulfolactate phosphatase [Vicinamibacteria bacterium]|jgi:2-phosphosulfolactate phosphatase